MPDESLGATQVPAKGERRGGVRGLAALLAGVLEPAARQRGFARAALFGEWPRIVGPALAARCLPLAIEFARGRARHGTLVLAAGPAAALELQHLAPQIIERINTFFGQPTVTRLRFRPMPLPPLAMPEPPPLRELAPAERERVAERVQEIADPTLREALQALGEAILRRQSPRETSA
ncbi:hypothetical protein HRbin40_02154 [bacterium HR40]|nr:hypothetical protein HRbin40_02154 [bacterium HR40]